MSESEQNNTNHREEDFGFLSVRSDQRAGHEAKPEAADRRDKPAAMLTNAAP